MKECVVEVRRGALMDRVRHEGMRRGPLMDRVRHK